MKIPRRFPIVAALLVVAAVSLAYLPYAGRGFKQDDFGWISSSRVRQAADWQALFTRNTGFYRPAVAVTFALDELAFGMRPLGYGLTNLALLLACLFAIAGLARALGLLPGAALAAGAIWALNFQGINMAVVWTSGRTALLLVLFAVLAARALVGGRTIVAAVFTLLALLSKEEAVMLPVLLFAWAGLLAHEERRDRESGIRSQEPGARSLEPFSLRAALRATWLLAVPLVLYAALRHASGAFGPLSAPSYYRFTLAPLKVADNVLKYLDFAATWPVVVVVLAAALARIVPRPSPPQRRIVVLGLVWLVAGYAITIFLPIRSPLYACFPAVGAALAGAALLGAVWSPSTAAARSRLVVAGLVLPFLLLPVYWARNVRHAKGAQLSAQLLHDLESARAEIPDDHVLVLLDDPRLDPTEQLPAAFGTLYDIAVRDTLGRPVRAWIEPPPDGWQLAGLQRPDAAAPRVVFALKNGHLVRQGR
jgi:hypothetical protein